MIGKLNIYGLLALLCLSVASCTGNRTKQQPIVALYKGVADFSKMDTAARDSLLHADSLEIETMMQFLGLGGANESDMLDLSESAAVKIFTPAVDSIFSDLTPVEFNLGSILDAAENYGFKLPARHYAAVVWGNRKSIVLTDSCMLIALNHYLGENYPGYAGWPAYMRSEKNPSRLSYDIVEALLANQYPYVRQSSSTVLSRILYEGALTMAKIRFVPNGTIYGALGYTREQVKWLDKHQKEIWKELVGKNLVHSTSEDVADKLVAPAPSTSLLSGDIPGRVGRYLGYCILVEYVRNNSTSSLPSLLQPDFYDNPSILIEAAY